MSSNTIQDGGSLSGPKTGENSENKTATDAPIDRSKLKPQKSILKTERTFIAREKTSLKREKTSFRQDVEYRADGEGRNREKSWERRAALVKRNSARNKHQVKDLDVASYFDKLPALPKEYTSWVLNKDFQSPGRFDDIDTTKLCQDWEKLTEDIFPTIETSLKNVIHRREKSCRRRCEVVEKERNTKNHHFECSEILDKYDEEIKLDEMMKENVKYQNLNMPKPCSGPNNYKLRMVAEKSNKRTKCCRYLHHDSKVGENEIKHMFENKRQVFKLPVLKRQKKHDSIEYYLYN